MEESESGYGLRTSGKTRKRKKKGPGYGRWSMAQRRRGCPGMAGGAEKEKYWARFGASRTGENEFTVGRPSLDIAYIQREPPSLRTVLRSLPLAQGQASPPPTAFTPPPRRRLNLPKRSLALPPLPLLHLPPHRRHEPTLEYSSKRFPF